MYQTLQQGNEARAEPPIPEASQTLTSLAERIIRTLGVARALAQNGRTIDLAGLEDGVGRLCAQTLDLPTSEGRCMLPVLREVLGQVDALMAAIRNTVAQSMRA